MTLYDKLFEMEVSICQAFPAMDPIRLRRETCSDVLRLLRRVIRYNNIQEERKAAAGGNAAPAVPADDDVIIVKKKNGDTITMRRARDDSAW